MAKSTAKTIYVLNGPNLNLLGTREPRSMAARRSRTSRSSAAKPPSAHGFAVEFRQSNHEGELVDWIQEAGAKKAAGIVINPGGYTHTSVAIHDAIMALNVPVIEVPHQQHSCARALPPPFLYRAGRQGRDLRLRHRRAMRWRSTASPPMSGKKSKR